MKIEKFIHEGKFCGIDNCYTVAYNEKGYFETLKEAKQNQRYPRKNLNSSEILLDDSDYSAMFMTF